MSEIPQTSEQMQDLTTSQDGTNVVAKLNPESYFFVHGSNYSQSASQAFGVVDDTKFRTTALVTLSPNTNIYTLCMGLVCLLPQEGDANKVNLILRPYRQPIKGLSVKYIIYRGLEKVQFFTQNNNNDDIIAGTEDTGSGFVQEIWKQFNRFYGDEDPEDRPEFMAKLIGYPTGTIDNNKLIDEYFYKVASFLDEEAQEEDPNNYELPMIPRGTQLGAFSGEIGIDIVLNDGDYIIEGDTNPFKLDLVYARSAAYELDASGIDGSTDSGAYEIKCLKENATKFIDIAAFYGLHANGVGKLHVDDGATILSTKTDIASRLVNFATKNNFYLYIQSNRQRSYNFYDNYLHPDTNNNFQLGASADNLTETTFGTNGWPVHIASDVQDPSNESNSFAFQLITDNHEDTALFVQLGELDSPHEENFVRNSNLLQQPSEDENITIDLNYTQSVILTSPAIDGNTIVSFTQLVYEGKQLLTAEAINPDQHYVLKDIDDVFGLIDSKSVFEFNEEQLPTIVNETLQIINFSNALGGKDIGVIKYQKIEDKIQITEDSNLQRITYETLMNNIASRAPMFQEKAIKNIDNTKSGFYNYGIEQEAFYLPKEPHYLKKRFLTINNEIITGLELEIQDSLLPNKKILGITAEEFTQLKVLISQNNLVNAKLFFKDNNHTTEEYFIAPEGYEYKLYNLFIVAEESTGLLKVYKPQEEVKVYHIKGLVYASKNYASAVPDRFSTYEDDYLLPLIDTDLTQNL
ncbi:hypothetical protein [Winogradskyella sp. SYSU M77433]|uniref:hypothetical protein n=1 Tax=Winogradskyella sp. SYSU M77433 TaxID=3042722 RepID=UPI00247FBA53|nr:hypothetical protein [Winogradskyella sp. SYSU M77433]MDH7911373.1 hypothetical protein [Winogradskyella sp. SYSU M77433]